MNPPSLRNRIRNGSLAMLVVALVLGALALPEVHQLGRAIRETLYRNYVSIDAAQHMQAALWRVELAVLDGDAAAVLPASRDEFTRYIDIEEHDITVSHHWLPISTGAGANCSLKLRSPRPAKLPARNSSSCINASTS